MRVIDEFLLVMMRLRLGLLDFLCVSTRTVSRTLITGYNVLADYLRHLIVLDQPEYNCNRNATMFQKIPCTRVITDCTKCFFETLSSLVNQSITYSYYKSYNTFKAFVTISCHISFTAVGQTECFRTSGSSTEWRKYSPPPPPPPKKKDSSRELAMKGVQETRRKAAVRIHLEPKMEQIKIF